MYTSVDVGNTPTMLQVQSEGLDILHCQQSLRQSRVRREKTSLMDSERFSYSAFRRAHTVSEGRFLFLAPSTTTRMVGPTPVTGKELKLIAASIFSPTGKRLPVLIYVARVDPWILSLNFNVSTRSEPIMLNL